MLTVEQIEKKSDLELQREYLQNMKHCFGRNMFGNAASQEQDLIAVELEKRGIHEIPNIFGAIVVDHNWNSFYRKQATALSQAYRR